MLWILKGKVRRSNPPDNIYVVGSRIARTTQCPPISWGVREIPLTEIFKCQPWCQQGWGSVWTVSGFCTEVILVLLAEGWRICESQGFLISIRAPSPQIGRGVLIYDGELVLNYIQYCLLQYSILQFSPIQNSTIKLSTIQPSQNIYILRLDYGHSWRVAAGQRKYVSACSGAER